MSRANFTPSFGLILRNGIASGGSRPKAFTCRDCLFKHSRQQHASRPSTLAAVDLARMRMAKAKQRTGLLVFGGAVVASIGFFGYTETGQYIYGGTERTGRVIVTLVRCINHYRHTLNRRSDLSKEEFDQELKATHQQCATLTFEAMKRNGSVFIKLGQHLSSLNYLLPPEWCDTFVPLQDQCPVSSYTSIRALVEKDTGRPFEQVFSSFDEEPLGAASLAQVHRATDARTGQVVAAKIQHPVLDHWAPLDMMLTSMTFKALKRAFPEYDLTWLSEEMEASLPQELDFACEGANANKTREYFKDISPLICPLVVPKVLWAQRRILVMEYMQGCRPDDLGSLRRAGISRDQVAAALARIFNTMIFSPGAPLHCDPHGGNLAIRANSERAYPNNFDIVLYDHGLYRWIPLDLQRNYAKLWLAVINSDLDEMRVFAKRTAGITDEEFPLFASAITGRDYMALTRNVSSARTDEERKRLTDALQGGLLPLLVQLLAKVPRIILLILKTNDLTRSLDTNLHTTQGPMRSFLILARYAAQTVFDEQREILRSTGRLLWPPSHIGQFVKAWSNFTGIRVKLYFYEWFLFARGLMGFANDIPMGLEAAMQPPQRPIGRYD